MQNVVEVEQQNSDQTIPIGYINETKSLVEWINRKDREIQGIKKTKQLNQSLGNLEIIHSELNKADKEKQDLVSRLSAIREPANTEFTYRCQIKSNQITDLEEKIKHTHADVKKYNEISIELSQNQNEHISIIQNNIEFEKILADQSKDKDLQDKAGTHLYHLYNDELGLQEKRLEVLDEKHQLIKLNSHLHDKENNEQQLHESSAGIKRCHERILFLKNEIEIKQKAFQNEEVECITIGSSSPKSSEYEINSFYVPTVAEELSESEQLKQQREVLESERIEKINQLKNKELSSQEKSILSSELNGIELTLKAKYDRLAELEKEKLAAPIVDSNKPKHVESIPKSTKEQGAVSKEVTKQSPQPTPLEQKLNIPKLMEAKRKEVIKFWNTPLEEINKTPTTDKQLQQISTTPAVDHKLKEEESLKKLLKAPPKNANRLKDSTDQQSAVSNNIFRNELEKKLQERQKKQAMQGTSTSTLFSSVNSSTSRDNTKTQEKTKTKTASKQFS